MAVKEIVKKLREVSNTLNAINNEVLQLSFKLNEEEMQVPESDTISRSHLLETFYKEAFTKAKPGEPETYEKVYASTVEAVIKREPPATSEIIRCKDCKYGEAEPLNFCNLHGITMAADDFCSYAVKEDE